jgi:hypothetical protein
VESTRKLRRELGYEVAKLHGLQQTVDLTLDDAKREGVGGTSSPTSWDLLGSTRPLPIKRARSNVVRCREKVPAAP